MNRQTQIPRFSPGIQLNVPAHYQDIYLKYRDYSMVAGNVQMFMKNLLLIDFFGQQLDGDFVECGTWKGGMACAMMALGGTQRDYHFFDSFAGLPPAQEIDGDAALRYQQDTDSPRYHDNCRADHARFMELVHAQNVPAGRIHVYKGWFEERLPDYSGADIAVLRLDGDWYESTLLCLEHLYPRVVQGGIILIDDYDAWEGCAHAVHEYLAREHCNARLMRSPLTQVAYLQKLEAGG